MAKNNSLFKIEGTLDNVTFYKNSDGHYVRTKGGVSRNRILNDPAFARTRENGEEFGQSASAAKLLRNSMGGIVYRAKDRRLSSRLVKVLSAVKNYDLVSARGKRTVASGLQTAEGKALLQGFEFNQSSSMDSILKAPYTLDTSDGSISIVGLVPSQHLVAPEGATHVTLLSAWLNLDFGTGAQAITYSAETNLLLDSVASTVFLEPVGIPAGTGTSMLVLLVEFSQEVNGQAYALNNGTYNAMKILAVF